MKINLKTVVLLFLFASANTMLKAQSSATGGMIQPNSSGHASLTDSYGNVIGFKEYSNLEGSPYFNADWAKGDVKFAGSADQKDKLVKYDELKDALYTQFTPEKIGEFDDPVVSFTIYTTDGLAHFSTIPGNGKFPDKAFFQVLSDGKVKLLKKNAKTVSEYKKELGSAVVTRQVTDNIDYYLWVSGKLVRIKKDKKTVEAALGDKQTELDAYIKSNSLNLKNDADLAKLITQYNAL